MDKELMERVEAYYPYCGGGRVVEAPIRDYTVEMIGRELRELREDMDFILEAIAEIGRSLSNGDKESK